MNEQLQNYARNQIKEGLALLPEKNHHVFKRLYSHENLDANVNDVVDSIPEEKLDWAMQQVQRTIDKLV